MGQSSLIQNFGLIIAAAFLMLAAQLTLKAGVGGVPLALSNTTDIWELIMRVVRTPLLIAGYLLSVGNSLFWIALLSRMEISLAAPLMFGIYFLMLLVASQAFLHEAVTPVRLVGTLLITAGLWFISHSS